MECWVCLTCDGYRQSTYFPWHKWFFASYKLLSFVGVVASISSHTKVLYSGIMNFRVRCICLGFRGPFNVIRKCSKCVFFFFLKRQNTGYGGFFHRFALMKNTHMTTANLMYIFCAAASIWYDGCLHVWAGYKETLVPVCTQAMADRIRYKNPFINNWHWCM